MVSALSDMSRYTGGFVNDLREGMGVMENVTSGWKFAGDWIKGRRHGNGELTVEKERSNLVLFL